jgi:hypothetical protein
MRLYVVWANDVRVLSYRIFDHAQDQTPADRASDEEKDSNQCIASSKTNERDKRMKITTQNDQPSKTQKERSQSSDRTRKACFGQLGKHLKC